MVTESSFSGRAVRARALLFTLIAACLLFSTAIPLSVLAGPQSSPPAFITFESGPVRPLAMTPNGAHLLVTNVPDGRLEVLNIQPDGSLIQVRSIPVGLEPVAVAARSDREAWVVNHLSDSVSVVDLLKGRVVRTLLVGDEPRDIVFAGPDNGRAFITTAHRGQHRQHPSLAGVEGAGDPQLLEPGVPRADVWVFDASDPGGDMGGVPLKIVSLFGDTPRALAVSPDGNTVYTAVFNSGNQTTSIPHNLVCDGFESAGPCEGDGLVSPGGLPDGMLPGGNPGPSTNHAGEPAPEVGLVVRYDNASGAWEDELGRNWNNAVRFDLPDLDVFAIDATTLEESASYAHVGTTLFNMAANPATGRLYVTNTEAQNLTRFEGSGVFGGSTVQGDLARARITVIDPSSGSVTPRHLNKHIDYSVRPAPPGTKEHSLATPLEMALSADGSTLYVAAFGSGKIGVFDTAALEDDSFDPTVASGSYIDVTGGGAAGLVLDETRQRLYAYTRFDNGVSVIDTNMGSEAAHVTLFNPEPATVVAGRPFLYDALRTSSNGEASCASCHIFGDMDHLVWDLGDPDGDVTDNPMIINFEHRVDLRTEPINGTGDVRDFHPMKGPMATQTLRGLVNQGAMHWRGDRSNGFFGVHATDSALSFQNFIVAFPGLVGSDMDINDPAEQQMMQDFTEFALQLTLPPNPNRNIDNSLNGLQQIGRDFFMGPRRADGIAEDEDPALPDGFTCNGCHTLDPAAGLYGTSTNSFSAVSGATQTAKIAHLRNLYQKVGMFGRAGTSEEIIDPESTEFFGAEGPYDHQGPQIRGVGFTHDGSVDTLFRFFHSATFRDKDGVGFNGGSLQRRGVEAYVLAFDSDLAPAVGQQVTLSATNWEVTGPRILALLGRAGTPFVSKILGGEVTECDVVVQGGLGTQQLSWLYDPQTQTYQPDRAAAVPFTLPVLVQAATNLGGDFTFTCVPPGSGVRIALDRDLDGILNGDDPDLAH